MKDIIFKSSKRMKIILIIFSVLIIGSILLISYLSETEHYGNALFLALLYVFLYLNSCETYILTDRSVLVKRGLSSTNEIPWSSITSVCPVSKGFRFGYSKDNGKKGFYVVINVKEVEAMRQLMEEYIKKSSVRAKHNCALTEE